MAAPVVLGGGSVSLTVSSSGSGFRALRRFGTGLSIAELKGKLELVVGAPAAAMDLELYSAQDELLSRLDADDAPLGSFPVSDGCRLHVIDRSGTSAELFEDLSRVEKYQMDDSEYDRRSESLRSFLRQRRWGRFAAEGTQRPERHRPRAQERPRADAIVTGGRCWVQLEGQPCCRATVTYVGQTSFQPGFWVGLCCDDPVGRHDGSVGGRRYFECPPGHGVFVRPNRILRGDWEIEGGDDEE
ncbi:tubulin-folding cofactor B, partial [Cuculus canorus]|uniref:tubulin-folding cofactor B n=1 Tax=Cuculus canorus TaxID=55661 RepID=UPI0023AA836B